MQKDYGVLLEQTISLKPSDLGNNYLKETESFIDLKNLGQAFAYLGIIYTQMTENEINNAIKMFDLAFSFDSIFSKLLCLFMKTHINKFIKNNNKLIDIKTYFLDGHLINQNYFSFINMNFLYEKYINDYINVEQTEPDLFIISIVPYIFDVKLNLYINEEASNNKEDITKLNKIILNKNKNIEINILYSSHSYHIIENKDENNFDINKIDFTNTFNYTNPCQNISELKKEYINIIKNNNNICPKCTFY